MQKSAKIQALTKQIAVIQSGNKIAVSTNEITVGTEFKIKGNVYKAKVFICKEVGGDPNPNAFNYKCTDIFGDVFYFCETNLRFYGDNVVILSSPAIDKAETVLLSDHVQKVDCGFEFEADGVRYYSAITYRGGEIHRYTVRLWDDSEGVRMSDCTCAAARSNMLCRHVIRAGEIDSARYGIEIFAPQLFGYKAHERRAA